MEQEQVSTEKRLTAHNAYGIANDDDIVALARDLGAANFGGSLSAQERRLLKRVQRRPRTPRTLLSQIRTEILSGNDPLGDAFCKIRPAEKRRDLGAFFTPEAIIRPILKWALAQQPRRVVDAGCGSGRFTQHALLAGTSADIVAVDVDPIATLSTRAVLACFKRKKAAVINGDYMKVRLPQIKGRTAFVGNPPYVRHHELSAQQKKRSVRLALALGHKMSSLAGLHAHFFLATANLARQGDVGVFVTSAEWMDVNYGSIVRDLMLNGLGGRGVHMFAPSAVPFEDAMTTAAITYFEPGSESQRLTFSFSEHPRVEDTLGEGATSVPRELLAQAPKWSPFLVSQGKSETHSATLKSIARVHRGLATGANDFFVMSRERAASLGIADFCAPVISRAQEIFTSYGCVRNEAQRFVLLEIPEDFDRKAHPAIDAYLKTGEKSINGEPAVCERWIPSHRKVWWSFKAPRPAIVVSYMARQAPMFATNPDGLALLNIAHGIFPIARLDAREIQRLVDALNDRRATFVGRGRTYHGGLEKFEPREMENLPIPPDITKVVSQR